MTVRKQLCQKQRFEWPRTNLNRSSTHSPAPKVAVTAKGDSVTKNVTTDSEGRFKIVGLPAEDYELSATASSSASLNGSGQMATEKPKRICFRGRNNATVTV